MDELQENEAFCAGVIVGIGMYQRKVVTAHVRNEPLIINGNFYYLEDGRERLTRVIDEICK